MKLKFYKICTKCHYFCRVEEEDQYCSICGTELIKNCRVCGEEIDNPYAEYCKKCGARYRTEQDDNKQYSF